MQRGFLKPSFRSCTWVSQPSTPTSQCCKDQIRFSVWKGSLKGKAPVGVYCAPDEVPNHKSPSSGILARGTEMLADKIVREGRNYVHTCQGAQESGQTVGMGFLEVGLCLGHIR